jgi:hypothetical protein
MKKRIRDLVALARGLGVEDVKIRAGGKHPTLIGTTPAGSPLRLTLPCSPSDGARGRRNAEADLRRAVRL